MEVRALLNEEIQSEFEGLKEIEIGTETYRTTVDGIAKLMDREIEMRKFDVEKEKTEDERKDRFVKNIIAVAGIAVPTVVTIWGTFKSLKFEETGSITTIAGRNFFNKVFKK